jgi:hypothetical protein
MGRPTLWLDSNVAVSPQSVRELAARARVKGLRVVVPAQVHLEICRQVRTRTGANFSPALIDTFLAQLGIEIVEARLDKLTAERWAEMLSLRYPTMENWKTAKLVSVKAKLPDEATLPAARVPMTTDWWIALAVESNADAVIAVEDKGEEWKALRATKRALSYEEALRWLDALPEASE